MQKQDQNTLTLGQRKLPGSDLRTYVADMLEGLSDMAADQKDEDLRALLALTTQAVQTINRTS